MIPVQSLTSEYFLHFGDLELATLSAGSVVQWILFIDLVFLHSDSSILSCNV